MRSDLQATFGDDCSELFVDVGPWTRCWGCRPQLDTGFDDVCKDSWYNDQTAHRTDGKAHQGDNMKANTRSSQTY